MTASRRNGRSATARSGSTPRSASQSARQRVLRNRVHNNGNMGAGRGGGDILFEENEIPATDGSAAWILYGKAAAWSALATRLTLRYNRVEANDGIGMWTDADNLDTLYEGNLFLRNVNSGISHNELRGGDAGQLLVRKWRWLPRLAVGRRDHYRIPAMCRCWAGLWRMRAMASPDPAKPRRGTSRPLSSRPATASPAMSSSP